MPYIDGLPVAVSIDPADVVAVDQGGTPGVPGTATTRQASLTLLLTAGGPYLPLIGGTVTGSVAVQGSLTIGHVGTITTVTFVNLPTSSAGLGPGTLYINGGFLCVA